MPEFIPRLLQALNTDMKGYVICVIPDGHPPLAVVEEIQDARDEYPDLRCITTISDSRLVYSDVIYIDLVELSRLNIVLVESDVTIVYYIKKSVTIGSPT